MPKLYTAVILCVALSVADFASAQPYTNRGRDFWVAYQASQMNSANMRIYVGAVGQGDSVTITAGNWVKKYWVPANTTITSDLIPKTGPDGVQLVDEGLYINKGIHITSKQHPVMAYAHLYSVANSGATMLLPTNVTASENYILTSTQNYASNAYSCFYAVAAQDSTWVEINPSRPTKNGWVPNGGPRPNGSYLVKLNKGDVYQVLGAILSGNMGYDLTGSSVKSVPNAQGMSWPIAVFSGSTRTGFGCPPTVGGTGDLIMQQLFPYQLWGKKYLTAPFVNSQNSLPMTCIYRVMVKDVTTVVYRNGIALTASSLVNGLYYEFVSSTADYITSDKPVILAQYMSSTNSCPNTGGDGDPEMIYLSPLAAAIPQTAFYRNTVEDINSNHLTLIIPTPGLVSLKIDGLAFNAPGSLVTTSPHPNYPGYTIVTRKWPAAIAQCYVESNYAFTGYTYGLGSVESYGYNIGLMVDSLNLQSVRYNTITGHAFYDANANSIKDATEPFYKPAKVNVMRGTDTFSIITPSGYFETFVDTGTYHSRLATLSPYHTVVPVQDTSSFSSYFNIDTVVFAVQPIPGKRDMFVNLFPISPARPGFRVKYKLVYGNKGTDTADVTITLVKASKLNFDSASVAPAYAVADTLRWNFTALKPGDGGAVTIYFTSHTPPALNQNDTLVSVATITSGATDETPADNISTLQQRVTGSYDPNDKKEIHDGRILRSAIATGEKLQYTIRFQNTGSDTAFNIFIKDTLDTKLDWNSLQMISASHDYQLSVKNGVCTWIFNDILLVDSNRNEPMSHGYVSFEINARETVVAGDVIQNRASIYFDHNLPIVTNTDNTSIVTAVFPVKLLSFTATKREGDNLLKWRVAQQSQFSHFELERSDNGRDFTRIATMAGGPEEFSYADNKFPRSMNYYRLRMVDVDGSYTYSPVRKINNTGAMDVTVYPNPATNLIQVRVESIVPKALDLQVLSADGRVVITGKIAIGAGSTIVPVNTAALAKGVYMLRLAAPDETPVTIRFQKQ